MAALAEKIEAKCRAFAEELAELVQVTVSEAFAEVTINGVRSPGPVRVERPRPNGLAKHEKRSPMALEKLTRDLQLHIERYPGKRIEPIAGALGCSSRELSLPIKKLIAGGAIRAEGVARATKYFPVGKGT